MFIEFHFVCNAYENDQLWNPTGAIPSIFTFCFDFFDFFYLGMVKCWWSTSLRSSFGWLLLVGSHSMVQRHSILSLFIWDVRSKSREFPCSMGISVCLETHRRVSESLFRTKRANVHASIQQWSHSGFFLPKKQMDQMDRRINSDQKAQILCVTMPSRCHEGVRVLAVEMRKDNSASIRRASQLAQHPEGQVNGCKVPFVSLSRFLNWQMHIKCAACLHFVGVPAILVNTVA